MKLRKDPVAQLKPRLAPMNHTAVQNALTALRTDANQLDMMPPPESIILARLRHTARLDALQLRGDLDTLLAQSFRPYTELATAH